MQAVDLLGLVAACLTTGSFLPQAIKVIRTRNTASLSLLMYVAFNLGVLLWLVYGILRQDIAIILANSVTFLLSAFILSIKVYNVLKKVD